MKKKKKKKGKAKRDRRDSARRVNFGVSTFLFTYSVSETVGSNLIVGSWSLVVGVMLCGLRPRAYCLVVK